MIYRFDENNRNFDPNWILSIIAGIVSIVLAVLCLHFARQEFANISPLIESKCAFLGIVGVIIIKIVFGFSLLMMFGIIHIFLAVKIMSFIRQFFE